MSIVSKANRSTGADTKHDVEHMRANTLKDAQEDGGGQTTGAEATIEQNKSPAGAKERDITRATHDASGLSTIDSGQKHAEQR